MDIGLNNFGALTLIHSLNGVSDSLLLHGHCGHPADVG